MVLLGKPIRRKLLDVRKVRELLEAVHGVEFTLYEHAVPRPQRHVREARQSIARLAQEPDDSDIEAGPERRVTYEFTDEW